MELKQFQRAVIDDLARFLALLDKNTAIAETYRRFWAEKNVTAGLGGIQAYRGFLPGVPDVCLKVPTGGGKTFLAACALRTIFDGLPFSQIKAVVWLVPSDSILEQTLKNLSDPEHPYRLKINADFSHRADVYSKERLLNGQNFNPTVIHEQLSIFVLSYDSFRTNKKEGRKAYQENGNLASFPKLYDGQSPLLEGTDETALIQAIRYTNPVVVVDESHHAGTPLSVDMLKNFNPCFILNLTATPRENSNVISFVSASQLKKENMVKLPVIVHNRKTKTEVYDEAIHIREKLEKEAKEEEKQTKRYIRPIVLLQAQPKNADDASTFDEVKRDLVNAGIPENQIAIKTASRNELKGVDLLSKKCEIRYIVTVNALKEGWDCSFAYVLATIANRTSLVDVEQILGRILRLPHTTPNQNKMLNIAYVLTSSSDFHETLKRVIVGLNGAGFSERDYRAKDFSLDEEQAPFQIPLPLEWETATKDENGVVAETRRRGEVKEAQADEESGTPHLEKFFDDARKQAEDFEAAVAEEERSSLGTVAREVRESMNAFPMAEKFSEEAKILRLPQFVIEERLPLFSDAETTLLTPEHLWNDFSLRSKDTEIDFSEVDAELARVDVEEEDDAPKIWKIAGVENHVFKKWFEAMPRESRIRQCEEVIFKNLSKINAINDHDLRNYVRRVIGTLDAEQQDELQRSPLLYLKKIKAKIDSLLSAHAERNFNLWIQQGLIKCQPEYAFKDVISPVKYTAEFPNSLYTHEEEMNSLERKVVWELANLPNIKWWHRNISRTGFNINGYVNAFPDVIAMTEKGRILMIEPKGDHLENAESRRKAEIGSVWANRAGDRYRYYMVFEAKDTGFNGAESFGRFMEIVRGL